MRRRGKGGIGHLSMSRGHPLCRGCEIIEEDPDVFGEVRRLGVVRCVIEWQGSN